MSDSDAEKSFAPSARRKEEATKRGDVLRARELGTASSVLVGAGWLHFAGPWLFDSLAGTLRAGFTFNRGDVDQFTPGAAMIRIGLAVAPPVLLLGIVAAVAALAAQLAVGDGRWIGGNVAPKGTRINPASGLKRMFGMSGWIEMAKGVAKVALLGTIVWVWAKDELNALLNLGRGALGSDLARGWSAVTGLFVALGAGLVVIALIDVPVQWWRRQQRLRMTAQEMRDEHKQEEGSPEARSHRRQRQREIAMGGVAHAMREAQLVVTNPTHFAIAMAYDPAKAPAPIVLAKGRGDKALAMRELAAELALPVLEYPALARSVYYTTRERQVIREELYGAVATILAFVYSLKRGEVREMPTVDVPVALRFDAEGRLEP